MIKNYICQECGWHSDTWEEDEDDTTEQRLGYYSEKVGLNLHSKLTGHYRYIIKEAKNNG